MDLNRKTSILILLTILALTFTINITTFRNGHNWENSDFTGYISQARSLVEGTVDDLISHDKFMIDNSKKDTGSIMGPWGYPLILSPFYFMFGNDIYVMKVVTNLFFILSLSVVFLLFRDRLNNADNLLLVLILASSTWFFEFKDNVLSDIPFMFFSLLSLFLIKKFVIHGEIWINRLISYSLMGLSIFMSYMIRDVGLILLLTLLLVQFIEGKSSRAAHSNKFNFVPYLIFIALYAIVLLLSSSPSSTAFYFKRLSLLNINRFMFDIKYYFFLPSRFFPFLFLKMHGYGFEFNKFSLVIYSIMLLFLMAGIIKNFKKDYMFFAYMLISMPVILFFSSRQDFRLLIPFFPFVLYFLFKGLSGVSLTFELFNHHRSWKISLAHVFSAGLIIISLLYISSASYKNIMFNRTGAMEGPYSADSIGMFNYIKVSTDKDAAIIFHEPRSMYLFADRKSLALNKNKFKFDQLLNSPARYLACEKAENPYNLTPEELRKNFDCPYENNTYILCALDRKDIQDQ